MSEHAKYFLNNFLFLKYFIAHTDFVECDSCHRLFSVTTSEVGRRKNEVSKAGIHGLPSPKRVHKIEKGKGKS